MTDRLRLVSWGVEHEFDVELVSSDRVWRTSARIQVEAVRCCFWAEGATCSPRSSY